MLRKVNEMLKIQLVEGKVSRGPQGDANRRQLLGRAVAVSQYCTPDPNAVHQNLWRQLNISPQCPIVKILAHGIINR